jgi:hypothetical protein
MDQTNRNETEKKLDRWLDAALARYSHSDEAEPRMGLETRVLATLEADRREREQNRYRWPWSLVLAAGLAAVLIIVIARAPWHSVPGTLSIPSRETARGATTGTQARPHPPVVAEVTSNPNRGASARRTRARFLVVSDTTGPRLAQFPAPRPLSEAERLLVAMANNTPPEQLEQDAALQQRLRREIEEARMSGGATLEPRGK